MRGERKKGDFLILIQNISRAELQLLRLEVKATSGIHSGNRRSPSRDLSNKDERRFPSSRLTGENCGDFAIDRDYVAARRSFRTRESRSARPSRLSEKRKRSFSRSSFLIENRKCGTAMRIVVFFVINVL